MEICYAFTDRSFDLPHRGGPRSEAMANIKIQTPTHDARFDKTKTTGNQHQYPDFCSSGLTKMTRREPHVDSFVTILVPSSASNWRLGGLQRGQYVSIRTNNCCCESRGPRPARD